jgi:hypothetical protein
MDSKVRFLPAPLPAHEAVLQVTVLLAKAVHEILARPDMVYDFERVRMSAIDVPRIMGHFAAARLPAIGSSRPEQAGGGKANEASETLENIWDDFLREERIKRLPKNLIDLFEQHRDRSIRAAETEKGTFDYLKEANHSAYSFVRALLKKEDLDSLLPAAPAEVDVVFDAESRMYCAASDSLSGRIQWALQIVPHSLAAMVLVERVLAHEYLSHLVPRNRALGLAVLERWLVALLQEACLADRAQAHWKNILWPEYRKALEDHVAGIEHAKNPAANLVRTFGAAGVEVAATALYHSTPRPFWKFTRAVVTAASSEEEAAKIDRILIMFANAGPKASGKVISSKWSTINELHAAAGNP